MKIPLWEDITWVDTTASSTVKNDYWFFITMEKDKGLKNNKEELALF